MDRTLLLASFIFPERLDWFLSYLDSKFAIPKSRVFCYRNPDDESKQIVTFKVKLEEGKKLNLKEHFPNALIIHKRGDALYTINALNKLIEQQAGESPGNIDYKSVKINWADYQNRFILTNTNELAILRIERVF